MPPRTEYRKFKRHFPAAGGLAVRPAGRRTADASVMPGAGGRAARAAGLGEPLREAAARDCFKRNGTDAWSKAVRAAGLKDMLFGALWCLGGIIVTAATYGAARPGGSYIIAWGAILFGAIQCCRGMFRALIGR
jgi:hypothetical protein